ncbi:unnamed protein product, partial [Phaeothamnion confervicola]
ATESRLLAEVHRNPYQRALLLAATARFASSAGERAALTLEACAALREARRQEDVLLAMTEPGGSGGSGSSGLEVSGGERRRRETKDALPAPVLVSRSSAAIVVRPAKLSSTALKHIKERPWRQVCMYAKPAGAGTAVTLNNADLPGTGTAQPGSVFYDRKIYAVVSGLAPNESYVLAAAAVFPADNTGNGAGSCGDGGRSFAIGGIGETSPAITALNPLPLALCWAYIARTAVALGCAAAAAAAADAMQAELVATAPLRVGLDAGAAAVAAKTMGTTPLANPMHSLALRPAVSDSYGAAVLQAFVQVSLAAAEAPDAPAAAAALAAAGVTTAATGATAAAPISGSDLCLAEHTRGLLAAKRLLLAMQVAGALRDHDLVKQTAWKAFHALLPASGVRGAGQLVFQPLCALLLGLRIVPSHLWDAPTRRIFAAAAHRVMK